LTDLHEKINKTIYIILNIVGGAMYASVMTMIATAAATATTTTDVVTVVIVMLIII
jgi:hypothetical protein